LFFIWSAEVERLAAFAGAGVPPRLAGLRGGGEADELRGEVLDLEFAGFELLGLEKVLRAGEAEGVAATVGGLGRRRGIWRGRALPGRARSQRAGSRWSWRR
jgi:hypothetical protein